MTKAMWALFIALYAWGFALVFYVAIARGRDLDGRYASSSNSEWVKGLHNKSGMSCCDTADGHRLDDIDWRGESDGTYSVRIEGEWIKLSQDQILTEPNRLGVAMVWIFMGRITCFIPGSGS